MDVRDTGVRNTTAGTVAAIFHDHDKVERAITDLISAGFSKEQIGVAVKEPEDKMNENWIQRIRQMFLDKTTATNAEALRAEEARDRDYYTRQYTDDTLAGMGIPASEAGRLSDAMDRGDALVTVRNASRSADAIAILKRSGGITSVEELNKELGKAPVRTEARTARDVGEQRIQLFGEVLKVHKDRIRSGEVRLRKEVVTENKRVDVPVEREELVIERTPGGDRPAGEARIGEQKEIRVPLTEERVRVEKQPVVNEEVRVGKREVTGVEHVDDKVRHEEVRVENEGDVNVKDAERLNRPKKTA